MAAGNANADRDRPRQIEIFDRLPQALAYQFCASQTGVWKNNGEFFPAVAIDKVTGSNNVD